MTDRPLDWRNFEEHAAGAADLGEFVRGLPLAHAEIQVGRRCPVRAAHDAASVVRKAIDAAYLPDSTEGRFVWYAACFLVSFVERWLQATGNRPVQVLRCSASGLPVGLAK